MNKEFILKDLKDTDNLASRIANYVSKYDVITLSGDLGVGKTAFTRALIGRISNKEIEVLSPTFTIVQPYEFTDYTLWHFDLYRIDDKKELLEIGFYDALDNGVTIIEWPQLVFDILPKKRLDMVWSFIDNDSRKVSLTGEGKWSEI